MRSLQNLLNDFSEKLQIETVTASAFSQARKKFRHTAFIELLTKGLEVFYSFDYETYQGHRLISIDGSILRLPNEEELIEEFGCVTDKNRYHSTKHVEAKCSIAYDLLNKVPIHGFLARARSNDCALSSEHLSFLKPKDLVIADRAYASYRLFHLIKQTGSDFIIRCPRRRFKDGAGMFVKQKQKSKIVEILLHDKLLKDETLPASMNLRFIQVILSTGEIEVLITSLLDKDVYKTNSFKKLYNLRWGIETYYHLLKSRLALEHFSGKSLESVKQDFHATLFLSALETVVTAESNLELSKKETKYKQKVNKSISFNIIKEKAFEILCEPEIPYEKRNEKLTKLFTQNPTLIRENRKTPRHKRNWASFDYHRNRKKHLY